MERAFGTGRAGERVGAKSHVESQQLIKITKKKEKKKKKIKTVMG